MSRHIVLAGSGHANLYTLKRIARLQEAGATVTVINPDRHLYYSGMAPGYLSGFYSLDDIRIDVRKITEQAGATFLEQKIVAVDAEAHEVELDNGQKIKYDIISFATGSGVTSPTTDDGATQVHTVKPIAKHPALQLQIMQEKPENILIVGGGPAGIEMAGAIRRLCDRHHPGAKVTLVTAGESVLRHFPKRVVRCVVENFTSRKIKVKTHSPVNHITARMLKLENGDSLSYDVALIATGIQPYPLFTGTTLPRNTDGSLRVNTHLEVVGHRGVFGGGDCVNFRENPLDRVGVYAIRQGPVLFDNILRSLTGKPLRHFRPQKRYLLLFNLGDGNGVFVRNGLVFSGGLPMRLKDRIDSSFIRDYALQLNE
ncbi:MAG: NAD(P)/FAD-dependent oxidoreductase [Fidelibacterota bacterium]